MQKYPHVNKANKYAREVLSGKVVACKWIRLACREHLQDLESVKKKDFKYTFSKEAAQKVCTFVEMKPHTKGKWAAEKKKLSLEPWQCFFICVAWGWLKKASLKRRYTTVALYVPRKNGKSELAAALGLYMLSGDGEYGAEVYSGATSQKQAWEVFRPAKEMAKKSPMYRDFYGVEVNASNICQMQDMSRFEPIIGDPGDGASPHFAIVDEYHEHKTDALFNTMETGMAGREQGMILVITTAGDNISGPCFNLQKEIEKNLEKVTENESLFGLIYTVDDDDKWDSIEALKEANPNFGVSASADFLESQQKNAIINPRKQSPFKRKHLNIWTGATSAFINMHAWKKCEVKDLEIKNFEGQKCYIALDLASKIDVAAQSLIFPMENGKYARFGRYWLPESTVDDPSNEHYQKYRDMGLLNVTDGAMIDFEEIESDVLLDCQRFDVESVAFDPFQATYLITRLMNKGINCIEIPHQVRFLSDPMKQYEALIRDNKIEHNGDDFYTWMLSNLEAKVDFKDNVFPRKSSEKNKIDGPVADIMAFNRILSDHNNDIDDVLQNIISIDFDGGEEDK